MRLLIIASDRQMSQTLDQAIAEHGFVTDTVPVAEGLRRAAAQRYCAVLIAHLERGVDGAELCRTLRGKGVTAPVLLLCEGTNAAARITALDAGADDCLPVPFDMDELVARLRAILRRGQATESAVLRFADLELDLGRHHVLRQGRRIELTPKEFELLHLFMRKPNQALSRTTIGMQVWERHFDVESNVIDVCIHNLRRKIENGSRQSLIRTIIGTGYIFGSEDMASMPIQALSD